MMAASTAPVTPSESDDELLEEELNQLFEPVSTPNGSRRRIVRKSPASEVKPLALEASYFQSIAM